MSQNLKSDLTPALPPDRPLQVDAASYRPSQPRYERPRLEVYDQYTELTLLGGSFIEP